MNADEHGCWVEVDDDERTESRDSDGGGSGDCRGGLEDSQRLALYSYYKTDDFLRSIRLIGTRMDRSSRTGF
jgi:hypothetical protein